MTIRNLKFIGLLFSIFIAAPQAWASNEQVSCDNVQLLALEGSSIEARLSKETTGEIKSSMTVLHFSAKGKGIKKVNLYFIKEEGNKNSAKCNEIEEKLTIHFSDSQFSLFLKHWNLVESEGMKINCRESIGKDGRGVDFTAGVCTLTN